MPIYEDYDSVWTGPEIDDGIGRALHVASNPNLLDNPWFTVNQRNSDGISTGETGYFIDRWFKQLPDGDIDVNADGTLTVHNGAMLTQRVPKSVWDKLVGSEFTFSALLADGTVETVSGAFVNTDYNWQIIQNKAYYFWQVPRPTYTELRYYPAYGVDKNIKALKLELGSVSTLSNDGSPNYATELAKCQWYFRPMIDPLADHAFICQRTALREFAVTIPFQTMRAAPSLISNNARVRLIGHRLLDGGLVMASADTTVTVHASSQNAITILVQVSNAVTVPDSTIVSMDTYGIGTPMFLNSEL